MKVAVAPALRYHEPEIMRVIDRVIIADEHWKCWTYDGAHIAGRPVCKIAQKSRYVHRVLYALLRGKPEGQLHHTCENKACVNPWHLEDVTPKEHSEKHVRTHCPQGHPYSGENLYVGPSGFRECRACHRERAKRRWRLRNWGHE